MKAGKRPPAALTREAVRDWVAKRYSTRFHMTLIIASSVAVGVLVTAALMRAGVDALWLRWLPALACACATFFAGMAVPEARTTAEVIAKLSARAAD